MFDIHSVELCNFKAFRGKHLVAFPKRPGLYQLTGDNEVNPRLGANGVGKSTILDAIYWCLYGKTTRGLKAADIVTWGEKSAWVQVGLSVGPNTFVVERKQNPNSLCIIDEQAHTMDQPTLENNLRLGPEAFLYAVMLPQFGESFFDLTPTGKLTLLSQILDLDYWVGRSKEASDLAAEIASSQTLLGQQLAKHQGIQQTLQRDLVDLRVKADQFEDEKAEGVEKLELDLKTLEGEITRIVRENKDLEAVLQHALKRLQKAAKVGEQHDDYVHRIDDLEFRLEALSGIKATCPACLQAVSATHLLGERKVIEKQLDGVKHLLGALKGREDVPVLERNRDDFQRTLAKAEQKRAGMLERIKDLKARIATERKRANPYSRIAQEKDAALDALQTALSFCETKLATLAEEHAAVSFWVGGFKRVRLFIIEDTLRQLEVEVNNNLTSLGMLDWRVEFDVERENKSGTVTKGFVVLVHSPDHDKPVPLEAWSGGETQRIRLAGDLGMANLIMERAGLTSKIEFYDEPSNHLSDEGLRDLVDTLHDRANELNKRIWLVDHRMMDHPFTDTLTAVKGQGGSHLE